MPPKSQPTHRIDAPVEDEAMPSKRRKATVACNVCRARKTGCDGLRPSCSSCNIRGWQDRCNYQDTLTQPPALTILDLHKRLSQLESQPLSRTTDVPIVVGDVSGPVARDSDIMRLVDPASRAVEDESVYGPASTVAFIREVADPSSGYGDHSSSGTSSLVFPVPMRSDLEYSIRDMNLPARQVADEILQCYWDHMHPVYFILHRPSFEADYHRVWQSTTVQDHQPRRKPDVVFYSTLNMVLALGCCRYDALSTEQRDELAEDFYERSLRLLSIDTLNKSSLPIVQCLLLRGIYLFYTPYADRCWNVASVAIRTAQAIGLDTQKLHKEESNQLIREMRRRVWYTCVVIDRLLANTFGRSTIIHMQEPTNSPNPSVPLPALIDDEYLSSTEEGQQPPGQPSRVSYFHHTLQLQEILRRVFVLENKYLANVTTMGVFNWSTSSLGIEIDELLQSVEHFELYLPDFLQVHELPPKTPQNSYFLEQAFALKARAGYARLRILRPLMVVNARRYLLLNRQDCILENLSRICISMAQSVLDMLHRSLSSPGQMLPWHTLYYTFAAASILISGAFFPALGINLDTEPAKTSWYRALSIFEFHRRHIPSAEKGIKALKRLRTYGHNYDGSKTKASGQSHWQTAPDTSEDTTRYAGDRHSPTAAVPSVVDPPSLIEDDIFGQQEVYSSYSRYVDPFSLDQSWLTFQDFLFEDGSETTVQT